MAAELGEKTISKPLIHRSSILLAIFTFVLIGVAYYGLFKFFTAEDFTLVDKPNSEVLWSKSLRSGSKTMSIFSVSDLTASRDHVYISGPAVRGGQHLNYDSYVAKLSAKSGQLVQLQRYRPPDTLDTEFTRVAVDPKTSFLYLFSSSPDAGWFVQKIDANGGVVWTKHMEERASEPLIRVSPEGNLFMVEINGGSPGYRVQKRSLDGKLEWQRELDYKYFDFKNIDFDKDGNIYFSGRVKESKNTDAAIFSFDTNGKPRPNLVIKEASRGSNISFAVDKQKSSVNVIVKTAGQNNVWQKYSTSGKKLDSRQLDFEVDTMFGGPSGNIYFFVKDDNQVTVHNYTRSGKLLGKKKYDRNLIDADVDLSRIVAISADPNDDKNDAIYTSTWGSVSRLRVP